MRTELSGIYDSWQNQSLNHLLRLTNYSVIPGLLPPYFFQKKKTKKVFSFKSTNWTFCATPNISHRVLHFELDLVSKSTQIKWVSGKSNTTQSVTVQNDISQFIIYKIRTVRFVETTLMSYDNIDLSSVSIMYFPTNTDRKLFCI